MKKYRKREKRIAQEQYIMRSRLLNEELKGGKISQEEYERVHDLLDEQFKFVR